MNYTCSKCSLGVIVTPDGEQIKACTCEAPVLANLEAVLHGEGSLNN